MFCIFLTSLFMTMPLMASAAQTQSTEQHHKNEIKGEVLKLWYDQKKPMIVLDARSQQYFDGTLLPNAIWLPSDSAEKVITSTIPTKNNLIVVYCAGTKCPASGWLYDKLTSLGYTNVFEYHGGISDWISKGYPTTKS